MIATILHNNQRLLTDWDVKQNYLGQMYKSLSY